MTTFAPTADSRYIHTIRGGAYGYQLNEKPTALQAMGLGQGLSNNVRAVASTGNTAGACGRWITSRLYIASSTRLPLNVKLGKLKVTQFCAACVKLVVIQKNKGSDLSEKITCLNRGLRL